MRLMTKLAMGMLVVGVAACGDSSGPEDSLAGTYTLRTINGLNLPFIVFQDADTKVEIVTDVFTLTQANTFTEVFTTRETENTTVTTETTTTTGTYSVINGVVRMTDTEGSVLNGTFTGGNTLTVVVEQTFTLVFRK